MANMIRNKKCSSGSDDTPDSCWVCIYGKIYGGYPGNYWQPPEEPEVECTLEYMDWAWYEKMMVLLKKDEEEMARHCNHYIRRAPCHCRCCSEEY